MSRRARRTLVVAAVLALAVAACGGSAATSPSAGVVASDLPAGATASLPREVDVALADSMRDGGAFVLDVRQPDEWVAGHIEGATLIPLDQLPARLAEVPQDRQVVVVCRSGNRSAQGRDILLEAGYPAVTSMAGGMNDWIAAGRPVVTGE